MYNWQYHYNIHVIVLYRMHCNLCWWISSAQRNQWQKAADKYWFMLSWENWFNFHSWIHSFQLSAEHIFYIHWFLQLVRGCSQIMSATLEREGWQMITLADRGRGGSYKCWHHWPKCFKICQKKLFLKTYLNTVNMFRQIKFIRGSKAYSDKGGQIMTSADNIVDSVKNKKKHA